MINFGLPYMGSKSKIAADLIRILPPGRRFVDVFAGGCAMTHAALIAGKWERYLMNDVIDIPRLFLDAACGRYRDERRWISREDFARLRDTDLYVRVSWSFGNKGDTYIYSREIEPYKRACHYAVVFDDWAPLYELCPETAPAAQRALRGKTDIKQRRLAFGPAIVRRLKALRDPALLDRNPLYRSVRRGKHPDGTYLQSLESLESLERLESLESRKGDYREIKVQPGDVLYCDPPYKGTAEYNQTSFDSKAFYDWAEAQDVPVYISEYSMPVDRFMCIWHAKVISRLKNTGSAAAVERLYVPRKKISHA